MAEWGFSDILSALKAIPEIIRVPSANLTAAAFLLVILFCLLLLVVLSTLLILTRTRKSVEGPDESAEPSDTVVGSMTSAQGTSRVRRFHVGPGSVPALVVGIILAVGVVWIIGGVTTSLNSTCASCHASTPHSPSSEIDPHTNVACVECHESGGWVARVVANVPERVGHFIDGQYSPASAAGYGTAVSSVGCRACHKATLQGVFTNTEQGVRVSHKEPLDAGAECVDCHILESGIVSRQTVGMTPCLRCHNDQEASSRCDVCHLGDPAQAIRSTEATPGSLARVQVPQPQCDGCHDLKAEGCDSCHGVRLPHTAEFMAWGHAREGVIDLWENNGRVCSKCHNATRRPCTKCHTRFLTHGSDWNVKHYEGAGYSSPCGCHQYKAYDANRQFCTLCHPVKPSGAKP